jgi:hypothetical protein
MDPTNKIWKKTDKFYAHFPTSYIKYNKKSNEIKNYISITGKFRSLKVHISSNIWQYIIY